MAGRDANIGEEKNEEPLAQGDAHIPQPPRAVDEPFLMPRGRILCPQFVNLNAATVRVIQIFGFVCLFILLIAILPYITQYISGTEVELNTVKTDEIKSDDSFAYNDDKFVADSFIYNYDEFVVDDYEMECDRNLESAMIFPVKQDHEKLCMDIEIFKLDIYTNGNFLESFPDQIQKLQFYNNMEWYLKTISEDLTLLTISPGSIVLTVQGPMLDLRKAETVLRHGKFLAGSKEENELNDFFEDGVEYIDSKQGNINKVKGPAEDTQDVQKKERLLSPHRYRRTTASKWSQRSMGENFRQKGVEEAPKRKLGVLKKLVEPTEASNEKKAVNENEESSNAERRKMSTITRKAFTTAVDQCKDIKSKNYLDEMLQMDMNITKVTVHCAAEEVVEVLAKIKEEQIYWEKLKLFYQKKEYLKFLIGKENSGKEKSDLHCAVAVREYMVHCILNIASKAEAAKNTGYSAAGSTDVTSDYDISITGVNAMPVIVKFYALFTELFGEASGVVFDTNLYPGGTIISLTEVQKNDLFQDDTSDEKKEQFNTCFVHVGTYAQGTDRQKDELFYSARKLNEQMWPMQTNFALMKLKYYYSLVTSKFAPPLTISDLVTIDTYNFKEQYEELKKSKTKSALKQDEDYIASIETYMQKLGNGNLYKSSFYDGKCGADLDNISRRKKWIFYFGLINAFSQESYWSSGPLNHVVGTEQLALMFRNQGVTRNMNCNKDKNHWDCVIDINDVKNSVFENFADILKDFGHYVEDPTKHWGEYLVKTTKYAYRFFEAVWYYFLSVGAENLDEHFSILCSVCFAMKKSCRVTMKGCEIPGSKDDKMIGKAFHDLIKTLYDVIREGENTLDENIISNNKFYTWLLEVKKKGDVEEVLKSDAATRYNKNRKENKFLENAVKK